jgi:catechol 2,3-dioxygenase-like lactoylglutathione lyase family enzyme
MKYLSFWRWVFYIYVIRGIIPIIRKELDLDRTYYLVAQGGSNMTTIKTNYGTLEGVAFIDTFCRGKVKSCTLDVPNPITTSYGTFVPQFTNDSNVKRQKKKDNAITFYDNGQVNTIALEEQTYVKTSVGLIRAELVTFYKEGHLKRIYPTNGKIDASWTSEDEYNHSEPLAIDLSFGSIRAKVLALLFYPSGAIKHIALWPDEEVVLKLGEEVVLVKEGLELYEDGRLKSMDDSELIEARKGHLHHIEIYVNNLSVTKEFWGWLLNKLDYRVYQEWDKGVSYKLGATYIVFVEVENRHKDIPYHRCRAGLNHLAFHGGSELFVDEVTEALRAKGVPILYEDQHPIAGGEDYYAVFFEDPDRMKVEITAN